MHGRHGILIFFCLLFVLFEKKICSITNPDWNLFVFSAPLWPFLDSLSIYSKYFFGFTNVRAYTVVRHVLWICGGKPCPCHIIKNITNTNKFQKVLLTCKSWQFFSWISLLNKYFFWFFLSSQTLAPRYSSKIDVWTLGYLFKKNILSTLLYGLVKTQVIFLYQVGNKITNMILDKKSPNHS